MPRRKEPRKPDAVLDQLLAGADPKTAFDPNGLIHDLRKALAERVLNAEMDHHWPARSQATGEMVMARRRLLSTRARSSWKCREARFDPQLADSGRSRPRIRDDVARQSDLMLLGIPR
jgi:putative transposase